MNWTDRSHVTKSKCFALEDEENSVGGWVEQPLDAASDDPWYWEGWCFLSSNQLGSGHSKTLEAAKKSLTDCLFGDT